MIVDLFAGCGGSDLGLRTLGLDPIGFEVNTVACETRKAAGFKTVQTDLDTYPPPTPGKIDGIWASPPCKDHSYAGSKVYGRGKTGQLIHVITEWVERSRPRWVVCENVPMARYDWVEHVAFYETLGYKTWHGVVNCADLGLPQTRKRAILVASLDRQPFEPEINRRENHISMIEALGPEYEGWSLDRRAGYVDGVPTRRQLTTTLPCPSITVSAGAKYQWVWRRANEPPRHFTVAEAVILQGFPEDFPLQGTYKEKFRQVANAVPPVLAERLVAPLL